MGLINFLNYKRKFLFQAAYALLTLLWLSIYIENMEIGILIFMTQE